MYISLSLLGVASREVCQNDCIMFETLSRIHLKIILSTFLLNENVSYEDFNRSFEELHSKAGVHTLKKKQIVKK